MDEEAEVVIVLEGDHAGDVAVVIHLQRLITAQSIRAALLEALKRREPTLRSKVRDAWRKALAGQVVRALRLEGEDVGPE